MGLAIKKFISFLSLTFVIIFMVVLTDNSNFAVDAAIINGKKIKYNEIQTIK